MPNNYNSIPLPLTVSTSRGADNLLRGIGDANLSTAGAIKDGLVDAVDLVSSQLKNDELAEAISKLKFENSKEQRDLRTSSTQSGIDLNKANIDRIEELTRDLEFENTDEQRKLRTRNTESTIAGRYATIAHTRASTNAINYNNSKEQRELDRRKAEAILDAKELDNAQTRIDILSAGDTDGLLVENPLYMEVEKNRKKTQSSIANVLGVPASAVAGGSIIVTDPETEEEVAVPIGEYIEKRLPDEAKGLVGELLQDYKELSKKQAELGSSANKSQIQSSTSKSAKAIQAIKDNITRDYVSRIDLENSDALSSGLARVPKDNLVAVSGELSRAVAGLESMTTPEAQEKLAESIGSTLDGVDKKTFEKIDSQPISEDQKKKSKQDIARAALISKRTHILPEKSKNVGNVILSKTPQYATDEESAQMTADPTLFYNAVSDKVIYGDTGELSKVVKHNDHRFITGMTEASDGGRYRVKITQGESSADAGDGTTKANKVVKFTRKDADGNTVGEPIIKTLTDSPEDQAMYDVVTNVNNVVETRKQQGLVAQQVTTQAPSTESTKEFTQEDITMLERYEAVALSAINASREKRGLPAFDPNNIPDAIKKGIRKRSEEQLKKRKESNSKYYK